MRQDLHLDQRQTLKPALGIEQRQALTVLQLPLPDLIEYIDRELQENPLLEADPGQERLPGGEAESAEWLRYLDDASDTGFAPERRRARDAVVGVATETLEQHLLSQLSLSPVDAETRRIAAYLIGNLDEDGYLRVDVGEAARELRTGEDAVRAALDLVQTFHPAGVGARNVAESLVLQLRRRGFDEPIFASLVTGHLDDLAAGRFEKIAKSLRVKAADVAEALQVIKELNPRPGLQFSDGHGTRYLMPDVIIEKVGKEFVVLVNETDLPRLSINATYQRLLASADGDAETRGYISGRLKAAQELLKNVERRRLTLWRVVTRIVEEQKAFFEKGRAFLVPLTLKEVADALGIHESTVSRAVAGKYAQTPRGIFSLKFFFASGPKDVSAEAVKRRIAEIVKQENQERPYSDRQIAAILARRGIEVSRRTVAKYRDELGLRPARQRKRGL